MTILLKTNSSNNFCNFSGTLKTTKEYIVIVTKIFMLT